MHVSTDEVYGTIPKGHSKEGDPLEPNSPYAASKAGSDLVARAYFVTHKLPVVVTRASNNFGPYQYPEKALPLLITNLIDGLPFPLYGDGLQVRDWLYVLDHVRAIDLILRKAPAGEIYNIGGLYSCTNKELVGRVCDLMEKPRLADPAGGRPSGARPPLRPGLLQIEAPRASGHAHPFAKALEETISWYRDRRVLVAAPQEGRGNDGDYYRRQYPRGRPRERLDEAVANQNDPASRGPDSLGTTGGWIEAVVGSMFSGKTQELIRRLRLAAIARQKVQGLQLRLDTATPRTTSSPTTWPRSLGGRFRTPEISQVTIPTPRWSASTRSSSSARTPSKSARELAGQGRRVIAAGLDQDFRGEPFVVTRA